MRRWIWRIWLVLRGFARFDVRLGVVRVPPAAKGRGPFEPHLFRGKVGRDWVVRGIFTNHYVEWPMEMGGSSVPGFRTATVKLWRYGGWPRGIPKKPSGSKVLLFVDKKKQKNFIYLRGASSVAPWIFRSAQDDGRLDEANG